MADVIFVDSNVNLLPSKGDFELCLKENPDCYDPKKIHLRKYPDSMYKSPKRGEM